MWIANVGLNVCWMSVLLRLSAFKGSNSHNLNNANIVIWTLPTMIIVYLAILFEYNVGNE